MRSEPPGLIRTGMGLLVAALLLLAASAAVAAPAAAVERQVRLHEVDTSAPLPRGLARPEGTTRWDLEGAAPLGVVIRSLERGAEGVIVRDEREGAAGKRIKEATYVDPLGGDAALRWIFPDRYADDLRPGSRQTLDVDVDDGGAIDHLRIEIEVAGIGWAHLPSGPREVVLQRAVIFRAAGGGHAFVPESLIHRWVDPRAGVVAEISGPASDGRDRSSAESAFLLDAVIAGASDLKIHLSEHEDPLFTVISYGIDRGSGTAISSLTPEGYANAGALIAASTWNFSNNSSAAKMAGTTTPVDPNETCNSEQCGYTVPGGQLERTDKFHLDPNGLMDPNTLAKVNDVIEKTTDPNTGVVTIWVRAGSQNEGKTGGFGSGESRFCYTTFGGVTRSPVPLWQFQHHDAGSADYYYQPGDHWEGGPFNCELNIYNQACGVPQVFDKLYVKACVVSGKTYTGTQFTDVIKGGVVTIPSGHTFNALVVRSIADFCVFIGSSCGMLGKVSQVKTVNYMWQVPHLGTVARIQSAQDVPDPNSFTTIAESFFGFGLYPPLTISVTDVAETSVTLDWNPGNDPNRISDYRIYWDTDSGAGSPYAFDSVSNPSQVSFAGTTATISGLTPGRTYYFTVTSRSVFTDPSTHVPTTYESRLYPTQISGDPSFVYPVEVQGTTLCTPSSEVTGVTVNPAPGGIEICWNPSADPCVTGYRILGSSTANSPAGYSTVADVGPVTCWTGNPAERYFLVVTRGTGGTGPWGHYDR